MRIFLAIAAAAACAAACQPDSDKTNPAIATDEAKAEREATAPAAGASSFTEDQARQRITDAGYTDVSGLTKAADGSWQATASLSGQQTSVVVDYQGNVKAGGSPADPAAAPTPSIPPASGTPPAPSAPGAPGAAPGSPTH
jgi:hypothetical protein